MAVIIDSTSGNTKSFRLTKTDTAPRIEATCSTQIEAGVDGLSNLRLTISGAATPTELAQALQAALTKVKNLYGLA